MQVEHSGQAPPELATLFLGHDDDVCHTRSARQLAEERVNARTVVEDIEWIVHRIRRVLLEVLPAVAPGLRAPPTPTWAAWTKDVRAYRPRVRCE